jgi:hypothetical protein
MRPPPENFFFLDSGDLVSVCSRVLTTPDSVPPGPLYYHSPCVNTQATYSKAKPIAIIVNADVIQCVLIVYAQAAGVGKRIPGRYSLTMGPPLPHNIVSPRRHLEACVWLLHGGETGCDGEINSGPLRRRVVIAYGLPDQLRLLPALTTGVS